MESCNEIEKCKINDLLCQFFLFNHSLSAYLYTQNCLTGAIYVLLQNCKKRLTTTVILLFALVNM